MINNALETIGSIINDNVWLAPLLALLAGLLTSFTPCSLSSVPLVIGYVGGMNSDTKTSLRLSLTFILGSAIVFTSLGVVASFIGGLINGAFSWWYIVLGILMLLMALQIWGVINVIPSTYLVSKNKKKSYIGAFVAGMLGGLFSSPCATPVLVVILAIVSGKGNILWGFFLLLLYSIGHGVLAVLAGTYTGFVTKIATNERYGKLSRILSISLGVIVMMLGFYMLYLGF